MTNPSHSDNLAARKRCFAPVFDDRTRLLVLGSLPGDKSLVAQEYYGNRHNRFWRLMSEVIGADLVQLDYIARLDALLEQRIGLWDVVAEAWRPGSLDSHIRDRNDNDLLALIGQLPQLAAIAFNGGTAARLGLRIMGAHAERYRIIHLPSSSPANTAPYSEKLRRWTVLCDFIAVSPDCGFSPGA